MELTYLAAKIALGTAQINDYTKWAEDKLIEGVGSENIAILAGLDLEIGVDTEEVKSYFNKSLCDLGLILPAEENSILSYAKYICSEIVKHKMPPKEGLFILDGLYTKSDYEAVYSIWNELSEDIWMVSDNDGCIFNTGLTKENIDQYIVNVAEQFIKISEIELPDNFFNLCACSACGYIGEHKLVVYEKQWMPEFIYRIIYKSKPAMCGSCAKCGERFPLGMSDYEGRKKYLESMC